MPKFIKSIFLISVCFSLVYGQFNIIPLSVDYATFLGKEGVTYTEVYLSFLQNDLTYQEEDSLLVGHFLHNLTITQNDSVIAKYNRNYKNTLEINQSPQEYSQFIDVFAFELNPGKYELSASLVDEVSGKSGEYNLDLDIPLYSDELKISGIELSTKIEQGNTESNFSAKNNITIYPNPSSTFGILYPVLYFYFEAYNLNLNADGKNNYTYHYYISDTDGKRIRDFPSIENSNESQTIAEAKGSNIITMESGTYFLNIELKDLNSEKSAFTRKKFFMKKPERTASDNQVAARLEGYEEYASYSKDQLNNEFQKARYISTSEEIEIWENLNLEGMRRFIAQFWKRRDTNKESPLNEFKRTYFENIRLANANYSTQFKEGWRTDRGRVLLVYGKPDEIERNASSLDMQPYEIWSFYSLEGGAQFVFGDLSGNGHYELLHSTYRNEIKDPDWQRKLGKLRIRESSPGFDNY